MTQRITAGSRLDRLAMGLSGLCAVHCVATAVLLGLLASAGGILGKPASAYDIAEEVSKTQGRRIAANSVYRILDLFVTANLARRVESANAYVANQHPACLHDCIFLICDNCGQAVHIDDDSLTSGVRAAAKGAGFSAQRPVIEVRGTCGECAPD